MGCRCYERLQPNTKEFTRLAYTELVLELTKDYQDERVRVYFQQYKKRAKVKGKKKCHTETMRGRKSRYNLYIREPLMCRLGRTMGRKFF
jgi:hypothetical protein